MSEVPYRSSSASVFSPITPGVLVIDTNGLLRVGAHVGWRPGRGISDWKYEVTVIDKNTARATGQILPEDRIDSARYPNVHQAALACPVVVQAAEAAANSRTRRMDVVAELTQATRFSMHVAFHRGSGGGLFEFCQGDYAATFGGELHAESYGAVSAEEARDLVAAYCSQGDFLELHREELLAQFVPLLIAGRAHEIDDFDIVSPTVDRILFAISHGVLDEEAVELADDLHRTLGDEGYLERWEAWLAGVRGLGSESTARSIARLVHAMTSTDAASEYEPAIGGVARFTLPSATLARFELPSSPAFRFVATPRYREEMVAVRARLHALRVPVRSSRSRAVASNVAQSRALWLIVAAVVFVAVLGMFASTRR